MHLTVDEDYAGSSPVYSAKSMGYAVHISRMLRQTRSTSLTASKQGVGVPLLTENEPGSIPGRSAKYFTSHLSSDGVGVAPTKRDDGGSIPPRGSTTCLLSSVAVAIS